MQFKFLLASSDRWSPWMPLEEASCRIFRFHRTPVVKQHWWKLTPTWAGQIDITASIIMWTVTTCRHYAGVWLTRFSASSDSVSVCVFWRWKHFIKRCRWQWFLYVNWFSLSWWRWRRFCHGCHCWRNVDTDVSSINPDKTTKILTNSQQ